MLNDRLIRRKEMLDLVGLRKTTQWRLEKAGQFPARVRLGRKAVAWHLLEVEEWVQGRERVKAVGDLDEDRTAQTSAS